MWKRTLVSTPKAPDPVATATAQAGLNTDTALTQNAINMTNQVGPWGSTTYAPTGSTSYTNSQGKLVSVPQYTATTTYNPAQQAIFDKTTEAQGSIADIAAQQSASLKDYLSTNFSFDGGNKFDSGTSVSQPGQFEYSSTASPGTFSYGSQAPGAQTFTPKDFSYSGSQEQNAAYDLASQRILPQQQRATEALQTQLTNQGIRPGSAAWNNAISLNNQSNNDQLNQLALNGQQQFYGQALSTAQNNYGQQLGSANQNFNQQLASQNQGYNQALGTFGANTQAGLAAQQQNAGQELSAYQANLNGGLSAEQAAYQQALSTRQQQYQEALGNRNQPLNEITALLSGSQVSNPTTGYTSTPQAQVGGVDYTGLVSNNYKTQAAASSAALGGLFGLGGTIGSAGIKQGWFG
jgi:hypothetical protein